MPTSTNHTFPCPVCTDPREVKLTKKNKPYITCDPCGIQLFVRGPAGIAEFKRLLEQGEREDMATRIKALERRYRLTCPQCGTKFWAERKLVKTSAFDGSFKGFQCPQKDCKAIVPWEEEE
jgi:transcription elongation factor Elf1